MPQAHPTHRYFLWLALLVVILIILASVFRLSFLAPTSYAVPTPAADLSELVTFPEDAPPPTPQDYVTAQQGFQYLVSYTANGFAPATLTVQRGEIVRFTNNSNATLQLTLSGEHTLDHAEYFEYTFTKAGTFTFSGGTTEGTVTVQ